MEVTTDDEVYLFLKEITQYTGQTNKRLCHKDL